jgi:hypothetical protein
VPTHGGCDLDDFFLIQYVTYKGKKMLVLTRNPNTRGEYSFWPYHEGDWYPTYETVTGRVVSFPPMTRTTWPKNVLQAVEDGDVTFKKFPSDLNPIAYPDRGYMTKDCVDQLTQSFNVKPALGAYAIGLRVFHTQHPTHMLPEQYSLEDFIDKMTTSKLPEDIEAGEVAVQDLYDVIREKALEGKYPDALMASHIKSLADIPYNPNGPLAQLNRVKKEQLAWYDDEIDLFLRMQEPPEFLKDLGGTYRLDKMITLLRSIRLEWANANTQSEREYPAATFGWRWQNIILPHILPILEREFLNGHRQTNAEKLLTLWYACWMTPTTTTNEITDQLLFGTPLFEHLIDALVYFGICKELEHDLDATKGRIVLRQFVFYQGHKTFRVHCRNCDTNTVVDRDKLFTYHENNGLCKNCR